MLEQPLQTPGEVLRSNQLMVSIDTQMCELRRRLRALEENLEWAEEIHRMPLRGPTLLATR